MTDAKTRKANRERQRKYRELHRDEINEQRRERYNNRIAKGMCPRCGSKVKKGYTLCTDCCNYQTNLNRKHSDKRKKAVSKSAKAKSAAKPKAKPKTGAKAKITVKKKAVAKAKAAGKPKAAAKPKTKKK